MQRRIALYILFAASITVRAIAASVSDYPEINRYMGAERIAPAPAPMQYTPDGMAFLMLSADGRQIVKHDVKSGRILETLLDLGNTRETTLASIEGFTLSPDGSKILVWRNSRMVYRRSFTAEYFVYEIRSQLLRPLSAKFPRQQAPLFSPNGRMVAFVADNNVYVKKIDFNSEVPVTTDGKVNCIINGIPDWTYEEEFTTSCSMAWSPDNTSLCYLKYNETDVPAFSFPLYEGYCEPQNEYALYPGSYTYKYPVAGTANSSVSVHAYDIDTRKTKHISLSDRQIEYIPRIAFGGSPDRLMIATLNRDQTRMELYCANPRSTVVKPILVETWSAWIDPATYEDIYFADNSFVVMSCRTGWNHLYQYSYTGSLQRQITSGDYDVTAYYGADAAGNHYYQSTSSGAINRVVSKIDAKGRVVDLTPANGFGSAMSAAPGLQWLVLSHSDVDNAPHYNLVVPSTGKTVRTLVDNTAFRDKWASAPKPEFFTMESEGYSLNGYIIRPAGFDSSRRYPVIMSQYSGPGSQQVLNRWNIGAENYFAKAGYVVVCVDGRGTGGRGRAFSDVVYKRLGHYESIDQIAAARYAASLPYVDPGRIAIYGWSYGGYEAIMASSQIDAPYAAAVAVAPVTDWRYYDTVYAERYMLTPQANDEGYAAASTLNKIHRRKSPLLIITGTADDNVHMFNTVQYSSNAEKIGRWVDVVMFPAMNHSINGCNAREVVYARLLDYLKTNMR